jgi:hypothetical protein
MCQSVKTSTALIGHAFDPMRFAFLLGVIYAIGQGQPEHARSAKCGYDYPRNAKHADQQQQQDNLRDELVALMIASLRTWRQFIELIGEVLDILRGTLRICVTDDTAQRADQQRDDQQQDRRQQDRRQQDRRQQDDGQQDNRQQDDGQLDDGQQDDGQDEKQQDQIASTTQQEIKNVSMDASIAAPAPAPTIRFPIMIPQPGTPGAPLFTGRNITEFLRLFDDLCDDYGVDASQRARRVTRYCSLEIGTYLRMILEDSDWPRAKAAMVKEWKDEDEELRMKSLAFLEALKAKPRKDDEGVIQYCRQYKTASTHLLGLGHLSAYQQTLWFLQGLPTEMREQVMHETLVDPDDAANMDFTLVYDYAIEIYKSMEVVRGLSDSYEQEEKAKASCLVDKLRNKPSIPTPGRQSWRRDMHWTRALDGKGQRF